MKERFSRHWLSGNDWDSKGQKTHVNTTTAHTTWRGHHAGRMNPGSPLKLRRWSSESEEAGWQEFTGWSTRDERDAER